MRPTRHAFQAFVLAPCGERVSPKIERALRAAAASTIRHAGDHLACNLWAEHGDLVRAYEELCDVIAAALDGPRAIERAQQMLSVRWHT